MKMKKTKILGLVLAFIIFFTNLPFGSGIVRAQAGIKIDDINNFPDKYFRKYISERFDKIKDGYLDSNEILEADFINPQNTEIASLKGIEYFTNMKTLSFDNIKITELDLSKNINLKELYCQNSLLTSLDLTNNKNLVMLEFSGNKLASLDLSNNINLEVLNCSETDLISLDLSKNIKLKKIFCNYNSKLKELKLSDIPQLTELRCEGNIIEDLDLTMCPNLETLDCSYNNLKSLDLSKNKELDWICSDGNPITELDLSNNPKLWMVNCKNNKQLSKLILGNNPKLTTLNCPDSALEKIDLSNCPKLQELDCSASYVNKNQGKLKSIILGNNPELTKINCANNIVTELDVSSCIKLEKLVITNNQIMKIDLRNNKNLDTLSCMNNKLTEVNLGQKPNLVKINCINNQIKALDLDQSPELQSLDIEKNKIKELNLENNKALHTLNCYQNHLTSLDLSNIGNNSISFYGDEQAYTITLPRGSKTIKPSYLPGKFNLDKVENLVGANKENDALILEDNTEVITYSYKAKDECYIKVRLTIIYTDTDIVGPVNPEEIPNPNEDNYYTVTFVSEDLNKGKVATKNTFYVLNTSNKTLASISEPITTPIKNHIFEKWESELDKTKVIDKSLTFTAKFTELAEIIGPVKPSVTNNPDTNIYWSVTFKSENTDKGTVAEENTVYVLKSSNKNLDALENIAPNVTPLDNNKFNGWKPVLNHTTAIDKNLVINAQFSELDTIVGPVNPSVTQNPNSDKYCVVTFESEDKNEGTVEQNNTFYVLKTAGKTLADLAKKAPKTEAAENYIFNKWEPLLDNKTAIDQSRKVTAKFTELEAIIGPVDPDKTKNPYPDKYCVVAFESEDVDNGTIAPYNTFYVLKTAGKTLADLAKKAPKTEAAENYIFNKWEPLLDNKTAIDKSRKVIAKFAEIESIIGPVNPNVTKNPNPNQYWTVTFESEDTSKGTVDKNNTFYVLKSKHNLGDLSNKEPQTTAVEGYAFDRWDPKINVYTPIDKDLTVKAIFIEKTSPNLPDPIDPSKIDPINPNDPDAQRPSDVDNYFVITFESKDTTKGTVEGANTFYVPKNENKKLSDLNIDLLKKIAKSGFKFEKWDTDLNTSISDNLTVKAIFTKDETNPGTTPKPPVGPNNPQEPSNPPINPNEPKPQEKEYCIIRFLSADPDRGYIGRGDTITIKKNDRYTISDLARLAPEAIPYNGYEFAGWSPYLYGNQDIIKGDINIYARFVEAYVTRYSYERRRPRRIDDERDSREEKKEPVVEELNNYDKLEAILFINDSILQKSVNGVVSSLRMDIAPFIYQSRTMLPIRYVAESLGFMVTWDAKTKTVYLVDKENIVQIPVSTNNIVVNGKSFTSDVKPMIKNNRTMLPVANVARALGLEDGKDILWDAAMKYVTLKRNVLK